MFTLRLVVYYNHIGRSRRAGAYATHTILMLLVVPIDNDCSTTTNQTLVVILKKMFAMLPLVLRTSQGTGHRSFEIDLMDIKSNCFS
jgi:hypothetical protein